MRSLLEIQISEAHSETFWDLIKSVGPGNLLFYKYLKCS